MRSGGLAQTGQEPLCECVEVSELSRPAGLRWHRLRDARRKISCSVAFETDREDALRAARGPSLEQIGGALRKKLSLAGAWTGNHRTVLH